MRESGKRVLTPQYMAGTLWSLLVNALDWCFSEIYAEHSESRS